MTAIEQANGLVPGAIKTFSGSWSKFRGTAERLRHRQERCEYVYQQQQRYSYHCASALIPSITDQMSSDQMSYKRYEQRQKEILEDRKADERARINDALFAPYYQERARVSAEAAERFAVKSTPGFRHAVSGSAITMTQDEIEEKRRERMERKAAEREKKQARKRKRQC